MTSALPIASTWYETEVMGQGITRIGEPHVDPWLKANIWHVAGRDRDLLVDAGMGIAPLMPVLRSLSERPILGVATHSHFDHVGALHEFSERACHPLEADILRRPTVANTLADMFVSPEGIAALPYAGYDIARYHIEPAPPTLLLAEGDTIDLGDRAFQVLHLPGHSPGSIALLECATGILIAGDVLYDGQLIDAYETSDPAVYRGSLERLREVPVSIVHAGHGLSFDRQRMIELIDTYLRQGAPPFAPLSLFLRQQSTNADRTP